MNVFELMASLGLDSSEYDSALEQSEESAKGSGNRLAKIFGTAAKAATAAITAAAVAVGALAKSAISSYAEYEQLVGGVDKLFGEASGKLQAYADKAYLTAGMSANQYMETATSFSAALINSLKGDTQKAADITDVAMRSMSDNVNTFGSSMESVQFAYQGFAKQNYTMLDNLKLGYGGTKAEMERLIADANKYRKSIGESADLSIDSFADIVMAIEAVQEAQGIAGTTNKEAMKTIEGSANATKAAWQNVITAIGRGEGLSEAIEGLTTAIFGAAEGEGLLNQIIPRIKIAFEGIAEFVTTVGPMIAEKIPGIASDVIASLIETAVTVVTTLAQALPGLVTSLVSAAQTVGQDIITQFMDSFMSFDADGIIGEFNAGIIGMLSKTIPDAAVNGLKFAVSFAKGVLNAAPQILTTAGSILQSMVQGITEGLPTILSSGSEIILSLLDGIIESLPNITHTAFEVVWGILNTFYENLPSIVEAGAEMVGNLLMGIVERLPEIAETAITIINDFLTQMEANFPNIVNTGVNMLGNLARGVIQNLPAFISAAITAVGKFVYTISSNLPQILQRGGAITSTLSRGVLSLIGQIMSAAVQLMARFASGIAGRFGDVLNKGREIVNKIASGVLGNIGRFLSTIPTLFSRFVSSFRSKNWGSIGTNIINGIANGIRNGVGKIVEAAKGAAKRAFDAAKNFLGIKSPSRLFRDKIGLMMAEGMAIGFDEGFDENDYIEPVDALLNDIEDIPTTTIETDGESGEAPASDAMLIYRLLQQYLPALAEMAVVMYPDVVAGELAPYIDSSLGAIAVRKGRA